MGQPYVPRGSSGNIQGLHPDSGLAHPLETFTCPGHLRLSVHSEATSNLLALSPDLLIASSNTWPLSLASLAGPHVCRRVIPSSGQ